MVDGPMNDAALASLFLCVFGVAGITRMLMFKRCFGRQCVLREFGPILLPGALKDAGIFSAVAAAAGFSAMPFSPGAPGAVLLAGALAVALFLVFLNIADTFLYYEVSQRFFFQAAMEFKPANIWVGLTVRHKLTAVFVICALSAYSVFLFRFIEPAALGLSGALSGALCGAALLSCKKIVPTYEALYIPGAGIAGPYGMDVHAAGTIKGHISLFQQSSLINFLQVIRHVARVVLFPPAKRAIEPFSYSERAYLKRIGLLGERYAENCEPGKFKRILLVFSESMGQRMLPFYNRDLPGDLMPFWSSLLENYPRLDKLYASSAPTDSGMHAFLASRISVFVDRVYEDLMFGCGKVHSLPTLLREQGYTTAALCGASRHYGNIAPLAKKLWSIDLFRTFEDIKESGLPMIRCGWGASDRTLFAYAVKMLKEHQHERIFFMLNTMDTHPQFYYTLPEESFPESIRKNHSRLLRSLYEADKNLQRFFMNLAKNGLFTDETLIILTADHSPFSGEEYKALIRNNQLTNDAIPCLFISPGKTLNPFRQLRRDILCSQIDMLPTLIDGLGLRRIEPIAGRSLFMGKDNTAVMAWPHQFTYKTPTEEIRIGIGGKEGSPPSMREKCFTKWFDAIHELPA